MSEFRNNFGRKPEKTRSKKLNARVDLTPMVSISFLLIIFFMLTIEMSKPQAMFLGMPNYGCGPGGGCFFGKNRSLTLLLGDNDEIISYAGDFSYSMETPKKHKYGKNGIRKELINKNQEMQEYTGDPKRGINVIIKPSKKSNFANLVSILDEMNINKIATYAIVDNLTIEESKLLVMN